MIESVRAGEAGKIVGINENTSNTEEKLIQMTANKLQKTKYLFIIFRHGIFLVRNFQLERENERERKYVLLHGKCHQAY